MKLSQYLMIISVGRKDSTKGAEVIRNLEVLSIIKLGET